jgi:hypothetical protein
MTRYLRIAVAVCFVLLAVALIALWVRSYGNFDSVSGPVGLDCYAGFYSSLGVVNFSLVCSDDPPPDANNWNVQHAKIQSRLAGSRLRRGWIGLQVRFDKGDLNFALPYWFLTTLSTALAALFAFKRTWRFTVRGLLIATTLLAVALGLGVYLL